MNGVFFGKTSVQNIVKELKKLEKRLQSIHERYSHGVDSQLEALEHAAMEVGKSWSGSWIGYQSRVYYRNFTAVPAGARFSLEWGLMERHSFMNDGTIGEWSEHTYDDVQDAIYRRAGNPKLDELESQIKIDLESCITARDEISSLLTKLLRKQKDDYLKTMKDQAEKLRQYSTADFIEGLSPSGNLMSRDMTAMQQGIQSPPHLAVLAYTMYLRQPIHLAKELSKITKLTMSHVSDEEEDRETGLPTKIAICHGHSLVWKDLKDFLQGRLNLEWDEFNRVPVAGISNTDRLSQMLYEASFAFLVLTAEDEQSDGKLHARMNVVHEAGLFQGRLGFRRAIILLEETCEEFSNIQGLGQIRFPKGKIKSVFEDIRQVLEREHILKD